MLASAVRLRHAIENDAQESESHYRAALSKAADAVASLSAPDKVLSSLKESAALAYTEAQHALDARQARQLLQERSWTYPFVPPSDDLFGVLESAANLVGLVHFREGDTLSLGGQITVVDFVIKAGALTSIKLSYDLDGHREQPEIADVLRHLIDSGDWTQLRTTLAWVREADLETHATHVDAFGQELQLRSSLSVKTYFPTTVVIDIDPEGRERMACVVKHALVLEKRLAIPSTLARSIGERFVSEADAIEALPKEPYVKVDTPYEIKYSFSTATPYVWTNRIAFENGEQLKAIIEACRQAFILNDLIRSCSSTSVDPPKPTTVEEVMSMPRTVLPVTVSLADTFHVAFSDDNEEMVTIRVDESPAFPTRHVGLVVETLWHSRMT